MRAFQSSHTSLAGEAGRAEGHAQPKVGLGIPDVEMIVGRESLLGKAQGGQKQPRRSHWGKVSALDLEMLSWTGCQLQELCLLPSRGRV